jgi:probable phosphoglycerate mutase
VDTLILVRHAHAASNAGETVSSTPPGGGLSQRGIEQAQALHGALTGDGIELGAASELRRTQETLALALAGRDVPILVQPGLNEIGFGGFEGGPLSAYRSWAWANGPEVVCPGGGESRADAAARYATALEALLARPECTVLAVSHALPVRYVLDAACGRLPSVRVQTVPHAEPHRLERAAVEAAVSVLRNWAESPRFADTPFGG